MDTVVLEVEEAIFVQMGALVHCNGAGVDSSERVKVFCEELFLQRGKTVEHLDSAL